MAKDNVMVKSPLIKTHNFTRLSVRSSICHECCQKGAYDTPIGQTLILSCFKADWEANQTAPPTQASFLCGSTAAPHGGDLLPW